MADIPQVWMAYEHVQRRLSSTNHIAIGAGLEEALNVVHQPDFQPESITEATLLRAAATAGRQERHRALLRRRARAEAVSNIPATHDDEDHVSIGARSLDDAIHARRELARLAASLSEPDWDLLIGAAAGIPYDELALDYGSTSPALRSKVCRLRQSITSRGLG